jgi:hypothetical protein
MTTLATQNYNDYEFSANSKWQEYLEVSFPPQTGLYLERQTRKWYQKNIDSELDIDYDNLLSKIEILDQKREFLLAERAKAYGEEPLIRESSESLPEPTFVNPPNPSTSQNGYTQSQPNYPQPEEPFPQLSYTVMIKRSILDVEVLTVTMALFVQFWSFEVTAMLVCMKGIFALPRKYGLAVHTKKYWANILFNEFFHNMVYVAIIYFLRLQNDRFTFIVFAPISVHYVISACEWAKFVQGMWTTVFGWLINPVLENKETLLLTKAYLEMLLLLWFFGESIYGLQGFIFPVLYANFLRAKYMLSNSFRDAGKLLDGLIVRGLEKGGLILKPVLLVYTGIRAFLGYMDGRGNEVTK